MSDNTLDGLLARVANLDQSNHKAIANTLSAVARREDGHLIFRSGLQNNTDPLQVLNPEFDTLPYLYILFVSIALLGGIRLRLLSGLDFDTHSMFDCLHVPLK